MGFGRLHPHGYKHSDCVIHALTRLPSVALPYMSHACLLHVCMYLSVIHILPFQFGVVSQLEAVSLVIRAGLRIAFVVVEVVHSFAGIYCGHLSCFL